MPHMAMIVRLLVERETVVPADHFRNRSGMLAPYSPWQTQAREEVCRSIRRETYEGGRNGSTLQDQNSPYLFEEQAHA